MKHTTLWSSVSGGSCDDSNLCTKDDQCRDGKCRGTAFSCEACEDCNGKGCELKSGYCFIESRCYSSSDVNPSNPCMVGAQAVLFDSFDCSNVTLVLPILRQ